MYLPYIVFMYALQKIVCDVYFHFFIITPFQREEIPREALKCHMCDLTKFGSIKVTN